MQKISMVSKNFNPFENFPKRPVRVISYCCTSGASGAPGEAVFRFFLHNTTEGNYNQACFTALVIESQR